MTSINKLEKDKLEEAVSKSTSLRQVVKLLGTNRHVLKQAIKAFGLDISHFDFGRRSFSYVGKTFNRLIIREVFKRPDGRWFCRCDCECGTKQIERRLDGITSGRIPSCGCAYRNRPAMLGSNNPAFSGCGELLGTKFADIKRGAVRRGLFFNVSKEYLWDLFQKQEHKCMLSGMPIKFGRLHFPFETTASLDRIDSAKGYVEGNLQWVHKDVNKLKMDLDQNYFLDLCKRISDYTKK